MDFIRECWNRRDSPDDFFAQIQIQTPECLINSIICLFELCGLHFERNPLFLQYLQKLFNEKPEICMEYFLDTSKINNVGFIRFIQEYGDTLFNSIEIGSEFSARCALNALTICLNYEDKKIANLSINKLAESPKFSVLIASARLFFYSEVESLRELFTQVVPELDLPPSIPFPITLLRKAILENNSPSSILFTVHDIATAVISNVDIWAFVPCSKSFIPPSTFYHLYLHVISGFIANPTLQLAYMTTNLLVRVLKHMNDKEISLEEKEKTRFSKACVSSLFSEIRSNYHQEIESDHRELENCDFLGQNDDLTQIENLLTELNSTSTIDEEHIIDLVYQYPALSSALVEHILKNLNLKKPEVAVSYSDTILPIHSDFAWLLLQQGNFLEFIKQTLDVAAGTIYPSQFERVWLLPLTLLRFTWGNSSNSIQVQIIEFVESQPSGIREFLMHLLRYQIDSEVITLNDYSTPFNESITILKDLLNGNKSIEEIDLVNRPYLWVSVLIWANEKPPEKFDSLISIPHPDSHLINFLFTTAMLSIVKPVQPWICAAEEPDLVTMKIFQPNSLLDINPLISEQLNIFYRVSPMTTQQFTKIVTAWRAWSEIFGIEGFTMALLNQLVWKTMHSLVPEDANALYKSVAYVLAVLVSDNSENIQKVLSIITEMVGKEIETMTSAIGLADFALIIVCLKHEDWKSSFCWLLKYSIQMLTEDPELQHPKSSFALSLIKTSLHTHRLQEIVTEEVFDILYAIQDWKTLIDFFIVKHAVQEQSK